MNFQECLSKQKVCAITPLIPCERRKIYAMTTRAGLAGLLTGPITTIMVYPLSMAWLYAHLHGWAAGTTCYAWILLPDKKVVDSRNFGNFFRKQVNGWIYFGCVGEWDCRE
jgi:hypothetical protein